MSSSTKKVVILYAKWNDLITRSLRDAAKEYLLENGYEESQIEMHAVPGAFELPLAAQAFINKGAEGVVALGCVIRGATDHYDHVCSGVTSGIMNVQLKTGVPIGFGLLTVENLEQALNRAGGKVGNKGIEAAQAMLEMLTLCR